MTAADPLYGSGRLLLFHPRPQAVSIRIPAIELLTGPPQGLTPPAPPPASAQPPRDWLTLLTGALACLPRLPVTWYLGL